MEHHCEGASWEGCEVSDHGEGIYEVHEAVWKGREEEAWEVHEVTWEVHEAAWEVHEEGLD